MFTEAEIMEAHRQEIRDPRKRHPRRAPWRSYDGERATPSPARPWPYTFKLRSRYATPLPGIERVNRASGMQLQEQPFGSVPDLSCPEPGIASDSDIRRELMGTWLGELATYTHFCTWSFSRPVPVAAAMHFGRNHLRFLGRWDVDAEWGGTINQFRRNCQRDEREHRKEEIARQKAARRRLQAFLATERGETGGLLHLHALVGKITHLKAFCGLHLPDGEWGVKCCMLHSWACGYARVFPYDPELGAKHYVSKYVIKGYLSEWELLGEFHCRGRACSVALH